MGLWSKLVTRFGTEARRRPNTDGRWKMAIPAVAGHLCIGSPYAWSLLADPMTRELGIVATSAGDWGLPATAGVMSVTFAVQGITSALVGNWQNRVGPTICVGVAGLCFGGGMMLAGAGLLHHNLALVYAGYGVLGGISIGLAYTPPLQVLMEYFPDKKALASGITVAGFGSGALVFAPVAQKLMEYFRTAPQFIGAPGSCNVVPENGILFADVSGKLIEVVMASNSTFFADGYYAVGTGSTGIAETLMSLGAVYMGVMLASAWGLRKAPIVDAKAPKAVVLPVRGRYPATGDVHHDVLMKLPQFWELCATFFCVSSGGLALLSVAKPLMLQTFASTIPSLVTPAVGSAFVMALAAGNLSGRLFWPLIAQNIGFRTTVHAMTASSAVLFMAMPTLIDAVASTQTPAPFYAFIGSSVAIVSIMGGMYALLPAYESWKFGPKYVGSNHGRMLLGSTAAAIAGPTLLLTLREKSTQGAFRDLLAKVDPAVFEGRFGIALSDANEAISTGRITLKNLSELIPGLIDPSMFVYHSTLYTMGVVMLVAMGTHYRLKPVDSKYFETPEQAAIRANPVTARH
uniref:Major facilitator superfamily (MFS) profile domain-containing protein n=1 Tax=Spongospora subterranea TaxID=70186 RepID=A0A0H5R7X9_9EUKA|eukprot:CRZ09921.1 hypothetical protein [Spongospora subterranea]